MAEGRYEWSERLGAKIREPLQVIWQEQDRNNISALGLMPVLTPVCSIAVAPNFLDLSHPQVPIR